MESRSLVGTPSHHGARHRLVYLECRGLMARGLCRTHSHYVYVRLANDRLRWKGGEEGSRHSVGEEMFVLHNVPVPDSQGLSGDCRERSTCRFPGRVTIAFRAPFAVRNTTSYGVSVQVKLDGNRYAQSRDKGTKRWWSCVGCLSIHRDGGWW